MEQIISPAVNADGQPSVIPVALDTRSYDVLVGSSLIDEVGRWLSPLLKRPTVAIVTDETVAQCQLPRLHEALTRSGIRFTNIVVPAGEATKSFQHLEHLCGALLDAGVERKDIVIALGGGVIGDLTGFAASILRRGVRFVQIPTTLLAQVDSSVGGKTAINVPQGKNLIGAFYQPELVLCDTSALDTLPVRELRAGYAEVLKYALIDDAAFFEWLERHGGDVLSGSQSARAAAIAHSVRSKVRIVALDERETSGLRALLNLGHTFGHAVEAAAGYDGRVLHGEAVAMGMLMAHRLSARRGHAPGEEADRIEAHLRAVGLPTRLAEIGLSCSGRTLADFMLQDKKMDGGRLTFVMTDGIGKARLDSSVELEDIADLLDQWG